MNRIFALLLFLLGSLTLFFSPTYAGGEEEACFELLNTAVSQDNRFRSNEIFPNGDLSKVLFDEANNSYYDFSTYSNFRYERAYNPRRGDYYFMARRNNIGTIIAGNNYVVSQISGFGRDSNFDFPLESKTGSPFGDKYKFNGNFFKEYVIYTHHVNSYSEGYPLMSCGIVKVTPLEGRSFSDINESGYMTNILNGIKKQANLGNRKCASGFEGQYKNHTDGDFYKMKANVCVQSYDESDYLKMEVISIAYDNSSQRINEYYTHPLQVEAMRNNSNHADGLKGIQDVFRSKLENETCYSVVHGARYNLPTHCNNQYGPISYTRPHLKITDFLFPSAHAKLDTFDSENFQREEAEDTGMMVYGDLPYNLYKKLEEIPDESFREYMLLSVLPNFDELIHHRKENDVLLTPYEETFLACDVSYTERLEIVKDFLEKLNIENFSVSKLQYSNEKYGDCIIPYPDSDKLDIVVEGSFDSNKLLAEQLNNSYTAENDSEAIDGYITKREELLTELNKELENIEKRFNSGEINLEEATEEKNIKRTEFEAKIQENALSDDSSSGSGEKVLPQVSIEAPEDINYHVLWVIGFLLLIGGALISFVIYRKHKK